MTYIYYINQDDVFNNRIGNYSRSIGITSLYPRVYKIMERHEQKGPVRRPVCRHVLSSEPTAIAHALFQFTALFMCTSDATQLFFADFIEFL